MNRINMFVGSIKGDKIIWMITLILCIASLMATYSATSSMAYKQHGGNTEYVLFQQLFFIGLGMIAIYVCYRLDYIVYYKLSKLIFFITILLLAYTLWDGVEINYARRWIGIPWVGKTVQTSDLAKIGLIIYLAGSLSKRQKYIKSFKDAFLPIFVPVVLVCLLIVPEDLSTASIIFVTCLMMMFIGRVHLKYIFGLVGIAIFVLALVLLIGMTFPDLVRWETWLTRITEYFSDGGFQVQQSKSAIAAGELWGLGPGNSVQRNYLPFSYTDFIYAIICEEYGLIGGIIILFLYLWLLYRCTVMVTACPKTFGAILAYGLCINLVIQAFANIAVSVHLVPATGLTLPLVSMGGTSLLISCISIGIILSVSRYVEEARIKKVELVEREVIPATEKKTTM